MFEQPVSAVLPIIIVNTFSNKCEIIKILYTNRTRLHKSDILRNKIETVKGY